MSSDKDHESLLQARNNVVEDINASLMTSEKTGKIVLDHKKSIMFASITAVWVGLGNYLLADSSALLGTKSLYPQCIGNIVLWLMYHLLLVAQFKYKSNASYFTKTNSSYYRGGEL